MKCREIGERSLGKLSERGAAALEGPEQGFDRQVEGREHWQERRSRAIPEQRDSICKGVDLAV